MQEWPERYEAVIRAHCRFADSSRVIDPDESLALLGVDSMDIINMLVDFEETFGFQMPEELMAPEVFASPGSLWKALEHHIKL